MVEAFVIGACTAGVISLIVRVIGWLKEKLD